MKLEFDELLHEYRIDGHIVPSVTTVINKLAPGYDAGEYFKQRGRALHLACQYFDEGRLKWSSLDPEIDGKVRAWQLFRKQFGHPIEAIEQRLGHPTYRYAGTLDRLFRLGAKSVCIVDLKSTLTTQVQIQIGGYAGLIRPTLPKNVEIQGYAVELRNDGTYKCLPKMMLAADVRRAESTFLAFLTTYNWLQTHHKERTETHVN